MLVFCCSKDVTATALTTLKPVDNPSGFETQGLSVKPRANPRFRAWSVRFRVQGKLLCKTHHHYPLTPDVDCPFGLVGSKTST